MSSLASGSERPWTWPLALWVCAAFGCGDDASSGSAGDTQNVATDDGNSEADGSVDDSGSGASSDGGPVSDGSSSGDGGEPLSLEFCMQETGIDLDCGDESRFQYVAFGDVLGCGGSSSFTQEEVLRFTFSLDAVVDRVIQVQSLRLVGSAVRSDTRLEATGAAPVPLPDFPATYMAPAADLLSSPPGLFDVLGAQGTITLDAVPTTDDLDAGATVTGTFELTGGAVTNIGNPVDDPSVQVFGCFAAPGEAHPIELD